MITLYGQEADNELNRFWRYLNHGSQRWFHFNDCDIDYEAVMGDDPAWGIWTDKLNKNRVHDTIVEFQKAKTTDEFCRITWPKSMGGIDIDRLLSTPSHLSRKYGQVGFLLALLRFRNSSMEENSFVAGKGLAASMLRAQGHQLPVEEYALFGRNPRSQMPDDGRPTLLIVNHYPHAPGDEFGRSFYYPAPTTELFPNDRLETDEWHSFDPGDQIAIAEKVEITRILETVPSRPAKEAWIDYAHSLEPLGRELAF